LADYTTAHGVPTALALANQAKLSPVKHEEIIDTADRDNDIDDDDNDGDDDDDDDDIDNDDDEASMSTDDYTVSRSDINPTSKARTKSTRGKSTKNTDGTSIRNKQRTVDAIQYGPIVVKPRKSNAPTLANGRRSKDEPVSMTKSFAVSSFSCLFQVTTR
jgi:hypothetical protein